MRTGLIRLLYPPTASQTRIPASTDPSRFRQDLVNIARTTLSSKVLSQDKDYFANLAVDAVLRLKVQRHFNCLIEADP